MVIWFLVHCGPNREEFVWFEQLVEVLITLVDHVWRKQKNILNKCCGMSFTTKNEIKQGERGK